MVIAFNKLTIVKKSILYNRFIKLFLILFFHFSWINTFAQNTILWTVEHPKYQTKSYLLGSYHQMGNSFVDSIPKIKSALLSSEFAIFETTSAGGKVSEQMNKRKTNFEYKTVLKRKDLIYLERISSEWNVPLSKVYPIELLIKLKQTYTEKICGTVKSTDKYKHFDQYLMYLAKKDSIRLYGLETDSLQIVQINNLSKSKMTWNDAKKPIHKILKNIKKDRYKRKYCQTAQNYMDLKFDYQFTETCVSNLKTRNDKWIPQLEKILPERNSFITVGLLHLYGECGLIVQLRKRGYKVEPVELKIRK